jgi:hypothetical protein
MSALARHILADMQQRRELLESGHARFWRLFHRPVDDTERVTLSPPAVDVKDAPATSWPTVVDSRKHGEGQLWVTDRRAVMDSRGKVLREWSWDSLAEVRIIPGYVGVLFTPYDGDTVTVVRQFVKDRSMNSRNARFARWLTVEGTWAAATGRLDEWYAALPGRLSGSG